MVARRSKYPWAIRAERCQITGYYVINDVLSGSSFRKIKQILQRASSRGSRTLSFAAAVLLMAPILVACPEVVDALVSAEVLRAAQEQSGITDLSFVPDRDVNQISLLHYRSAGDGIGWHVDGNILHWAAMGGGF